MGNNLKYKTINVYVDTDVDIPLSEVVDQLDDDDLVEEMKSRGLLSDNRFISNGMPASTLYDDMKIDILKEAYSKYSLEELQKRLS